MTASKPEASPKSPAESVIEELKARITESLIGSPDDYSEQCYRRAMREAIAVIRQAERSKDLVERIARGLAVHSYNANGLETAWNGDEKNYADRKWQDSVEQAQVAIAAMAPVSAETVQPITHAKSREMRLIDYDEVIRAGNAAVVEYWDKKAAKYTDADLPSRYEWLAIIAAICPYLRQSPIDIEAGAIACSQWVYGSNHGKPSWDRLSEEHREQDRKQARATARAWGLI